MDMANDIRLLGDEFPFTRAFVQKATELVKDVYEVHRSASSAECLQIISQALMAALTDRCWVFDLHATEPGFAASCFFVFGGCFF